MSGSAEQTLHEQLVEQVARVIEEASPNSSRRRASRQGMRKQRTWMMSDGSMRAAPHSGCPVIRDWSAAREKIEIEEHCRAAMLGGCEGKLEAAHTASRRYDQPDGHGGLIVDPDDVIGLCTYHHQLFDQHRLDVQGLMSYREQAAVVEKLGIEAARRRLAPSVWRAEVDLRSAALAAELLGGDAA